MPSMPKDWLEFIDLLNAKGVDYVLVGGHAVAFYGRSRLTQDIDFFVRRSQENVLRLIEVLREFGFESLGLAPEDLLSNFGIQLGYAPNRIDLLMQIEGVNFDEAFESRVGTEFDGRPIWVISRELLIRNKLALGRPRDLADAHELAQEPAEE